MYQRKNLVAIHEICALMFSTIPILQVKVKISSEKCNHKIKKHNKNFFVCMCLKFFNFYYERLSFFSDYRYLNLFAGKFQSGNTLNDAFSYSGCEMIHFLAQHYPPKSETEINAFELSAWSFFIFGRSQGLRMHLEHRWYPRLRGCAAPGL